MQEFRTALLVALIAATLIAAPVSAQQAPPPAPATPSQAAPEPDEKAEIKGFRSATWGMTEAQVRDAIKKDFGNVRVMVEQNPADLWRLVWADVENMLPGAGVGRVTYILGDTSKKLMQVSVTWGGVVNPAMKPEAAIAAANLLRGHFTTLGFKPDTVVQNAKAQDGSIVVFRGFDYENRMTSLVLRELARKEGAPPEAPVVLHLSYIQNIKNPGFPR